MNPGEWVIFKHTTVSGTCIFPKIRRIKDANEIYIAFDDKEFPKTIPVVSVLRTFQTARAAKVALEKGLEEWARRSSVVDELERQADRARLFRFQRAVEIVKQGMQAI